nr:co-chaperone protein p23-1-like [Aegilops tauschii subsp. strangulata]
MVGGGMGGMGGGGMGVMGGGGMGGMGGGGIGGMGGGGIGGFGATMGDMGGMGGFGATIGAMGGMGCFGATMGGMSFVCLMRDMGAPPAGISGMSSDVPHHTSSVEDLANTFPAPHDDVACDNEEEEEE